MTIMTHVKPIILSMTLAVFGWMMFAPQTVYSRCGIPCGIYDDHHRVQGMLEDAVTVEKSARLISRLAAKSDAQSQN
jgi:nickel superoxide dismutase